MGVVFPKFVLTWCTQYEAFMRIGQLFILLLFILIAAASCKKGHKLVPDNDAPYYGDVHTVVVKNYINRLYIDLIGREPLNVEMDADLQYLRDNELSLDARNAIATRLQSDTAWIDGDSSYFIAYYHRMYDLFKVRLIEGASNGEINQRLGILYNGYLVDSLNGNTLGMAEKQIRIDKYEALLASEFEYRNGTIGIGEVHARMIDNGIYDFINMNSFNFINATFNDLYFRYPTQYEFNIAFGIIEYNQSDVLFGKPAQNKEDYIGVVTSNREFYEGLIIWAFNTLLQRDPGTDEVFNLMQELYYDHDFQKLQRHIVTSDEYANFK